MNAARAQVAKESLATGRSLRDVVLEKGLLSADELDRILDPRAMTEPRARAERDELSALYDKLASAYEIRILSRPNVPSFVRRVPDTDTDAIGYYFIVKAVTANHMLVPQRITSEETGLTREVTLWGVRVSEETFKRIEADNRDDVIVPNATLAVKRAGRLGPDYLIAVLGGTITEW